MRDWLHRTWTYVVVTVGSAIAATLMGVVAALITFYGGLAPLIGPWGAAAVFTLFFIALVWIGAVWRKGWLANHGVHIQ